MHAAKEPFVAVAGAAPAHLVTTRHNGHVYYVSVFPGKLIQGTT